jgi:hypothetical protein
MLGQTLWRKVFPLEIDDADIHLHQCVYDVLLLEHWSRAQALGRFATSPPVARSSKDRFRRIAIVNYAIVLLL